MNPGADQALAALPAARLLIHAHREDASAAFAQGWLVRGLAALGTWLAPSRNVSPARPARVQIEDLHGRCHFAADVAQPSIDLALPAGTYHVTLRQGTLQRRYTVTLERGATVDLDLPLAAGAAFRGP